MEKIRILLVLVISFALIFSTYKFGPSITGMFIGFGSPSGDFGWWNVSWHYRVRIEINSTAYDRTDWPVEQVINFTDLLPSGTFDENSTRVIEYSPSGSILYEIPSQFDKDDNYSSSTNARGTLSFLMNGTTVANGKRIFYVYYDSIEDGAKQPPTYSTNLTYSWDGEEFNVNNTYRAFWVDTSRGENTSGLYRVMSLSPDFDIWPIIPDTDQRTIEYSEYSNGTYNFSFDFRNNATLKYSGPVRIVVEQKGNETLWNSSNVTEGFMTKRYVFYERNKWIEIETNLTNNNAGSITRNSTFAGAIALDAERVFGSPWSDIYGDTTPPGWWYAANQFGDYESGIIQVNQSGTSNFWVPNSTGTDRIGIDLNSTTIPADSSITETAAMYFSFQESYNAVKGLRDRLATMPTINQTLPERWYIIAQPSTNASVYNRNETVLITANVSANDPYNLTKYMNVTLDMGTASSADDQIIVLYDKGNGIFNNTFDVPNNANLTLWTINFTAYTNNLEFLNYTTYAFNITNVLNVTVNITVPLNKKPLTNSFVNANIFVRNYRTDSWVSEAVINCTYGSVEVINKTNYNNGTYSVNFTSPSQEGDYTLYCNATKNGNLGNNSDNFSAETATTNVSIASNPSSTSVYNITLYNSSSFVITANATNLKNGTAYASNISLELLNSWSANTTSEHCGDIGENSYCVKSFNITVPNGTSPSSYYINVTINWRNPDDSQSSNKTQFNATVESNPKISVEESKVSSYAGDGTWNIIGNFTVFSIGNDNITNITFSCFSGAVCNNFNVGFIPANISSVPSGSKQNVSLNVSIPLAYGNGTYNGTVNVSAQNSDFDTFVVEINLSANTNVSIATSKTNYTANNITQQSNESFEFWTSVANLINSSARFVNISLSLPSGWTSNSTLEDCGNLTRGNSCYRGFKPTIPNGTLAGNYLINISSNWTNLDNSLGTNKTTINVTVSSNPAVNLNETNVTDTVPDGTSKRIGNFTVLSVGNDVLRNITFNCYQGTVCQYFNVSFSPVNITNISVNSNQIVSVNATAPLGFLTGTYNGTVNVSAQNDNYKNLTLFITVPSNRTWTMSPTTCQRSEYPDEGTVCEVLVRNLGNDIINFTVSPKYGNYTEVNSTSFYINAGSNYAFNVTYNITNISQSTYNSTFDVDANQSNANPGNMTLNITLFPYMPPLISLGISPNSTEQNSSVEIYANVTDRSNSGIRWVNVSVITPNGTSNQTNMTLLNQSGNLSQWYFEYPGNLGDTMLRGFYNVTISALDNIGNLGNYSQNFTVYTKLIVTTTTLTDKYLQGDTGSIYHIVRDMNGTGINSTNVTFTIKDPSGNISYYTKQTTNEDGTIYPMPTFTLASDAMTGNYTLFSNTTYYDPVVNTTLSVQKNSTFQVQSRTTIVAGLFADIATSVVWYPSNNMTFGILVYNGEGTPVDPTSMNLKVYDPVNTLYLTANMSQMTRQATGYYTYVKAMGADTPSGMFLAVLNVSQNDFQTMKLEAFRVSHGGPYDVKLNLFENEVPQGSNLDFSLSIENKGEVSEDVSVDYWVTGQNTTYYLNSESVLTPALTNQSFTRSAYIYSDQPLGTYTLNARVTYDNVQPPILVNTTFVVTTRTTPPPPPNVTPPAPKTIYVYGTPTGGVITVTPPSQQISASILITTYNSNISLARNFTRIESVTVKNNGITDLHNISLFIIGIPVDWFNITPDVVEALKPENSSVFLVEFHIPGNANVGEYKANLVASSGVVSDQKPIVLTVYKSLEELLADEINGYKNELQDLYIDIRVAEREGKDTSTVMSLFNETQDKINGAELDLNNNRTEDALDKISGVPTLITRMRDLLNSLEAVKEKGFELSIWMILVIFIGIIGGAIIVVLLLKKKKITKIRPYIISLGRIADAVKKKKVSKEEIDAEREKLTRMLKVLEKEKEEGIITGSSYDKMKKSIEEKLSKTEKK